MSGYVARRNVNREPLFAGREPLLSRLDVELTERCDNGCIHCCINRPAGDEGARARELSTAQWEGILGQAAGLGALSVRFTGGEPLLRSDFCEIYLCARRLGMTVALLTNARGITPELADLFVRVPPLEKIEVSVYGMRAGSYEAVTGAPGSFAQFRRGVDLLRQRDVPFLVKGVLLPATRPERDEFEAWAATIPGMEQPPGVAMFFDLRGRRDSPAKNRIIETLRVDPADGADLVAGADGRWAREMERFCARFLAPADDRLFGCGAAAGSACVDAYGHLQPCLLLRHPGLSRDLKVVPLRDALAGLRDSLDPMRAADPGYLVRCARCFLKGLCEQCPAKSWSEHGTLDRPVEYLCRVAHEQARRLGLLYEGENAWEIADGKDRVARMTGKAAAS